MIDFGCGSGILAISASKLGAKQVYALDIDDDALENCRLNAGANQIAMQGFTICNSPQNISHKADILLANILAKTLVELAKTLIDLCKSGGKIILSGILQNQAEEVLSHYKNDCKVRNILQKGEWISFILKKF